MAISYLVRNLFGDLLSQRTDKTTAYSFCLLLSLFYFDDFVLFVLIELPGDNALKMPFICLLCFTCMYF